MQDSETGQRTDDNTGAVDVGQSNIRPRYSTHRRIDVPEISGWLRAVESGRIPACEEQHLLCAYVRRVFATERLWVDRARLERYMGYQRYFPFELADEEKFLVALWLCTYREGHFPRWPDALLYVGRGFGKSGFAGFCAFCLMSPANGIPMYDVDVCATTEEQARISYDDVWRILQSDTRLFKQGFSWNKVEATCTETQSRFKYWSGNSESKDGMKSGVVIFDELHAYVNSEAMGVFTGGLGKKAEPRRLMTTTDGTVRDGPLDEYKARSEDILHGREPDNGLLPFICKLDDRSEVDDEALWPKANPRLISSPVLMDEYRREVVEWRRAPARHTDVMTKRFNLPETRHDIEVTSWDNLVAASRPVETELLKGRPCVAGIDYAKTTDMVGACLLFRLNGEYQVLPHAWWCSTSSDAGEVKAPLKEWESAGLLTITDEVEISPESVAEWIRLTASSLNADLRCVGIDNYRFTLMRRAISEIAGLDPDAKGDDRQIYLSRPSDIMRIQPVIDSVFARHEIAWGESPLMRWATNNAKLEPAPNNNWTYGKIEPHKRKTDPFMAVVHAFCIAERLDVPEPAPVEMMQPMIF